MNDIPNLMDRPDLVLLAFIGLMILLVIVVALISVAFPRAADRQLVKEILNNPAIQERMKVHPFDVPALVTTIFEQMDKRTNEKSRFGLLNILEKVNQDITWDVSGLIGVLVTIVLMVLLVTRPTENLPRDIVAGWTMILGFYFGKAGKK